MNFLFFTSSGESAERGSVWRVRAINARIRAVLPFPTSGQRSADFVLERYFTNLYHPGNKGRIPLLLIHHQLFWG